jgi:GNAT superfamily N-acetyltransferase
MIVRVRAETTGQHSDLRIRPGELSDEFALLGMFDEAVAWLVTRGQAGQWGDQPWSQAEKGRRTVRGVVEGGGLHVLERCHHVVGALEVGDRFDYAKPVDVSELYVRLVLTSRAEAGQSLGRLLIEKAAELAQDRGAVLLRVDCWAGAPSLVGWYESCGFERSHNFSLGHWHGQVLEKPVAGVA